MNDDARLLRQFAEEGSEAAFTELVRRHIDLVYGAALRRTGEAHHAADVAQQVFATLARQARKLTQHTVLSAWLHTVTRNIAINLVCSEQRRKSREQTAVALAAPGETAATSSWEEVRSVLDAAIDTLPEPDRAAVVLRFLERRSFVEIGVLLHVSADGARMRTDRALQKLRTALARQGITSTAAALGTLVSTHAGVAAPAGLAATIAPAALAAALVPGGWGATGAVFVSTKTIISILSLGAALGLGIYLGWSHLAQPPAPLSSATPPRLMATATARPESTRPKAETERPNPAIASVTANPPASALPTPSSALTLVNQQRGIMNNLRLLSAAADQFHLENGRAPTLDDLVGETKYVRRLEPVAGESYLSLTFGPKQVLTVTGPDGAPVIFDPAASPPAGPDAASRAAQDEIHRALTQQFGAEFVQRVRASIPKAITAYRAANNGQMPRSLDAVIPYFPTPQEGADFVEFAAACRALGLKL